MRDITYTFCCRQLRCCKLFIRELYSVRRYSVVRPLSQEGGREPVRVASQNTMSIGGQEYAEHLRPLLSPRDQKLSEHYICPPSIYLLPAMGHAQQQLPTTFMYKKWPDQEGLVNEERMPSPTCSHCPPLQM